MIFVTSDLHFCHDKAFLYEPRGFHSVREMNAAIVKNWNNVVNPEDDVYVLGDLMLNDNEEGARLLSMLHGHLHIILGNHDTKARIELYKQSPNVVEVCDAKRLDYLGYHFFLCHYPTLTSNHDSDKPLAARLISLCGHTHTPDRFCDWDKGYIYHCELDAHNNYPEMLENIIVDLQKKIQEDFRRTIPW